jgi:hypothetical protein
MPSGNVPAVTADVGRSGTIALAVSQAVPQTKLRRILSHCLGGGTISAPVPQCLTPLYDAQKYLTNHTSSQTEPLRCLLCGLFVFRIGKGITTQLKYVSFFRMVTLCSE